MMVSVELTTLSDSIYMLPDVEREIAESFVKQLKESPGMQNLTLINASGACLVMPFRIVQMVHLVHDGEPVGESWTR